jgi:LysM repeat protein
MSMKKFFLICLIAFILIGASPLPEENLPDYAFVEGLVGHGQAYPLSCESRSAADLAGYWGIPVSETTFFEQLPKSDNPEVGFVGSVFGTWGQTPPNPYGVHAPPIANLLREYGLDAQAQKGFTVKEIKAEIARGRPVMVWVIGRVWSGTAQTYAANDGSKVTVAAYEHSMIAYGYDLSAIYLLDAGSGSRAAYSYDNFRTSWRVLGNLAVTASGPINANQDKPANIGNLKEKYIVQPGDYLSQLAEAWGISWQDLAAINGITYPYVIFPGQVLFTGGNPGQTDMPPTPSNPTALPTVIPQPTPTPTTEPTAVPVVTYMVQHGDHLMQISSEMDIDWKEIVSLNGLVYPYLVYPGQQLVMPDGFSLNTDTEQPAAQQSTVTFDLYTIGKGEHLMQIARKFELSWKEIADLNNLVSPYTLQAGQEIKLPFEQDTSAPPSPVEPAPDPSSFSGEVYVVQPGDFLYVLAQTFGVNWQTLASYNQISYPYMVYPGQELILP